MASTKRSLSGLAALTLPFLYVACSSTPETPQEDELTEELPPELSDNTIGVQEASFAQDGQGIDLDEEARYLSLREQKQRFLVEQALVTAERLRAEVRLEEAERELLRALEIDPDNLEVKRMLGEVGALLGRPAGQITAFADQSAADYELRLQQLRSEAESSVAKGEALLARGDYDGAIAEFSLALDHVRWASGSIDWQGIDERAAMLLESARSERLAAADRAREEARAEAFEALQAQEQEERQRRQREVLNMISSALAAFEAQRYEDAMRFAEEALRKDPRNEQAADIRDSAFRAGREKLRSDFLEKKKEQYRLWEEEIQELMVPWSGVITLPDQDRWAEITELRSVRRGLDLSERMTKAEADLRQEIREVSIPGLSIDEVESLSEVVATLRTLTGLPLVVDPLAEDEVTGEGVIYDFTLQNPLTAENALNLIASNSGEEVTWTVKHDVILFTTREKARGDLIIYNHDVQDLIFGLTDFLGPRIDRIRLLEELEDDDGGGPFGGISDEIAKINEPDQLTSLIQENVATDSWEEDGVTIEVFDGNLIVVNTPEVQRQVRDFLEDLRLFSSSMVTIESKFMTVEDNWIQEIGVDFRGLDNPGTPFTDLDDVTNGLEDNASQGLDNSGSGNNNASGSPSSGFFFDDSPDGSYKARTEHIFDAALGAALTNVGGMTAQWTFLDDAQVSVILRMVEKSQKLELINDQFLSVHNTQRAYVTVINQQAYIQDFDVEVAQLEAIANPEINVLIEGIVLDVRPTIHHDRRYLTLEIQPTVANVVRLDTFSTSLGSNSSPVEFQLPELEVQSVFTTALVPDGGSILLGGLSRVRNIERRSEVPWLANIPVVGFFFKTEGYNDERKSLMVLIRAWITDVKESLGSPAAR